MKNSSQLNQGTRYKEAESFLAELGKVKQPGQPQAFVCLTIQPGDCLL